MTDLIEEFIVQRFATILFGTLVSLKSLAVFLYAVGLPGNFALPTRFPPDGERRRPRTAVRGPSECRAG